MKPEKSINSAFGEEYTSKKIDQINKVAESWIKYDILNRRYKSVNSRVYLQDMRRATIRSGIVKDYVQDYPVFSEIYSANSLLPLAWMELMHSVKNRIYAQVCQNCRRLIPITDKRKIKKFCNKECNLMFNKKTDDLKELIRLRTNITTMKAEPSQLVTTKERKNWKKNKNTLLAE